MPIQHATFGYTIAFVCPGAVALWGVSRFSAEIRTWFGVAAKSETSVGGFLFILLAAISLGVFVSGVRWALIDNFLKMFEETKPPDFDRSKLTDADTLGSFAQMNEVFYRYYQFYANMLIAFVAAYIMWLAALGLAPWERPGMLAVALLVAISLFFSARDSLKRYFEHLREIMGREGN